MEHYLSILLLLPLVFAVLIPVFPEGENGKNTHALALAGSVALFAYSLLGWNWLEVRPETYEWLPSLGINFAVGSDGLTITLVMLTTFLMMMACAASLTNITKRVKLYYSMLFILIGAVLGVFVARDLFLFFLFWELELIPMYLLISIWGGPRRDYAAMKFVLYTLFGSIFLVASILALYFHAGNLGVDPANRFMFDVLQSAIAIPEQGISPEQHLWLQVLIFLGFFISFGIKLPMVPFHTWLPDAHVEAPTPISMLLAGILLKMGAYGMLRFAFGFLPEAAQVLAPYIAAMAVINIVYTAGVALVQSDLKKLIAYSSVSHMGFVLLGLAALNPEGFNGAVFVMFSHGLVSAALFMCVGTLYLRTHTRMISEYGGFGAQTPVIFYFFMFMSMASLGLPLLISFAGESLTMYGAFISKAFVTPLFDIDIPYRIFQGNLMWAELPFVWTMPMATIFSAIGIVIGAAYLLWMLQRVFFGPLNDKWKKLPDATLSEVFVLGTLALLIAFYGFYPQLLTQRFEPSVTQIAAPYREQQQPYVSMNTTGEPQE